MSAHTLGPVETLARLAIQSNQYVEDEEFSIAVDAVIGKPVFDAALDLLAALVEMVEIAELTIGWQVPKGANGPLIQARAAIAKAEGGAA